MARYADTLLAEGEVISLRTRQHWLAPVVAAAYPIILIVAAIIIVLLSQGLGTDGIAASLRQILGWLALAGVVIALVWGALVFWRWSAQDYVVTNRRVLKVEGIFNKHSADSSLEKINDAVLDQSWMGRIFGFGDLDIMTAAEESVDHYKWLNQAPMFKKEMLNQKNNLEMDIRYVPSPPLRATPAAEPVAAPAPAPAPAAAPAPAVASPPTMTAEQVTSTLARLADLRDRGAISPEEYEAKKSELLGRL
jgi:PH (Pleckstrin Homology) domain-containing protein/putative oligomerization/nucleic acid binding protein